MTEKKKPAWLAETGEGVSVKLSRPMTISGVKVDVIRLRAPTVRDVRAAKKLAGTDDEFQEIVLFASLAQCAPEEIERLSVRDYHRVQEAYFRLVSEDADSAGNSPPSAAVGD
jgi:hypothetical protein